MGKDILQTVCPTAWLFSTQEVKEKYTQCCRVRKKLVECPVRSHFKIQVLGRPTPTCLRHFLLAGASSGLSPLMLSFPE